MLPFDQTDLPLVASEHASVQVMMLRLLIAALMAAIIAYRPWRLLIANAPRVAADTSQAQVIICVAGAIMVIIIGDSVARAFGLVGLGAFIRFRSGIKDPRDAAVMFVMIGMGMAVGLGLYEIAAVVTAFVGSVVAFLDVADRSPHRKIRVGIDLEPGAYMLGPIRPVFPGARVIEAPNEQGAECRLVLEIDAVEELDAAAILDSLKSRGVAGIRAVALVD